MSAIEQISVLKLPADLLVEILCRWLNLKYIVHLDSAVCNYEARPALLALFSSGQCIVTSLVIFENSTVVQWFLLRGLQVSHLQLNQHIPELDKYLLLHSQSVRHVCCLSLEAMNMVAIHFHCLDTLEYRDQTIAPDLRDILQSNSTWPWEDLASSPLSLFPFV